MKNYLLINDRLDKLKNEKLSTRKSHLTRLLEQCKEYLNQEAHEEHPPTSITYMGMAAANLSLAYLLTKQEHYLIEAKRWLLTGCRYDVWGYGFLVDVDLSASWLLFGYGLSYNWIGEYLTPEEKQEVLDKLILQGNKMFDYGEENRGNCWSTNYWQNHNWINYTGLLTTAYAIESEYDGAQQWIDVIKDNFEIVFKYMPEDGSNYEGTGYWRYAMNFLLTAADLIKENEGIDYFESAFLKNTFDYRLYQSAPNWEENINFSDVHDRRSSNSISAFYKIASEYNNGHAQWLGNLVKEKFLFREAYQSKIFPGIMPEAFLEYIWYDEEIKEEDPSTLPLTRYFPDLGLAVIRSSWERDAMHFSIKSSAPGGNIQWQKSWELDKEHDWNTRSLTHYHVDFNSFILMGHDSTLAMDEGFHRTSRAKVHNMITVDDTGCVGEKIWNEGTLEDPVLFDLNCKGIYNVWRDVPEEATAGVEDFISENGYTYYVAESNKLYYPEMALTRNARNVIYSEMGYLIMLDELKSKLEHNYTWRLHSEEYAKKIEGTNAYRMKNGKGALNIYPVFPEDLESYVEETVIREIMTPQRPDDVREILLKTLCVENKTKKKDVHFINVLQPESSFTDELLDVKEIKGDEFIGVEIKTGSKVETFIYSETKTIDYCGIKSDANWVSIIKDGDQLIKHAVYQGTHLELNGKEIYKSQSKGHSFVSA
ncbi:protein of unknown function [Halolactibacillus halophilus]|uniref:Heparinase II N-terminal domain-containing protein n=1 Tax=Halolactibacillus halophilus TaxID=306540 RepID=A0A1I5MGT9_9BACI|nr:DUF4962 domain-containing protein [Halolactibacillus halophilus]GEM02212.1 hypothetical protein HHA03_17440 [Halolactibacillus halophilus]SFP08141.1 protein of unknown function [Halolactibacillus halophilus]